jgi:preprotein translocase subunit YajC
MKKEIKIENILNKRIRQNKMFSHIFLFIAIVIGIVAIVVHILVLFAINAVDNISIAQKANGVMSLSLINIPLLMACLFFCIAYFWMKRRRLKKQQSYQIKIAIAYVVNKRVETDIGLVVDAQNVYDHRYITFEIDDKSPYFVSNCKAFEIGVGFDCYAKIKKGESVYIVLINDEVYEDCIFSVNNYSLNSKLKDAVAKPIMIAY